MPEVRAVMICAAESQPRYHRRAEILQDLGYSVTAYCFSRGYFENNKFPPLVKVVRLGTMSSLRALSDYFRRCGGLLSATMRLWQYERRLGRARIIYVFNSDNVILAWLAWAMTAFKAPIILEIGDLRNSGRSNTVRFWAMVIFERLLCRTASMVVVTSKGYIDAYYAKYVLRNPRVLVIENRLPQSSFGQVPRPAFGQCNSPIRVGFVGLLRYRRTLEALLRAAAARPNTIWLRIYGDGELRELVGLYATKYDNIEYLGAFKNPADLPRIYAEIDVNYVVYDANDLNVRVAIPNKLFESIFFGVPIVAAAHTEFGSRVVSLDVGCVVDVEREDFCEVLLDGLDERQIERWSANEAAVPTGALLDDGGELRSAIDDLVKWRSG